MRQYIILFIAISLIISMYLIQINYLKETKGYLNSDIYEIEMYVNQNNYIKAKKSVNTLKEDFLNYKDSWDAYANHDDVGDITEYICTIDKYIDLEEKPDILVNIACLSNKLNHVLDSEKIKLSNIF